jgi:hypothetical protein
MRTVFSITFAAMLAFMPRAAALAQNNSGIQKPVTQQEIDRLKRQIDLDERDGIEAIADYHTETGDLNSRMDFTRYGGRLNMKWTPTLAFQLTGTRTNYRPISDTFGEHGLNLTLGMHSKFSEAAEAHFEAGATRFSTDTYTINALAAVAFNASDHSHLYATASRNNVEESLLSSAGIRPVAGPFAGQLVGRVMENRFVIGGSGQVLDTFDVFAEGGGGDREGRNVPANFFKSVSGGAGYNIVAGQSGDPLSLLRATYELSYFGFADDRSGFGGVSQLTRFGTPIPAARIGSDGILPDPAPTRAGVGGYFSPKNFVSNVARLEAKGGSDIGLSYGISGFLGSQDYTDVSARWAHGLAATVTVGITDRVSLPVTYLIDNYGPFKQQSLYGRFVVRY